MKRQLTRVVGLVAAAVLAAGGVVATPGPQAAAAPAPWEWRIVEAPFSIGPGQFGTWGATCPSGFRAITGGLAPGGSFHEVYRVRRTHEGLTDSGDTWQIGLENTSGASASLKVVVHCVRITGLPPIHFEHASFRAEDGRAESVVFCPDGQVVLSGNAAWSNVNTRTLDHMGPTWSGTGWIARGTNTVEGEFLTVGVYCVNPADVPGFVRIEAEFGGTEGATVTCPAGTRILNGGTQQHFQGEILNLARTSYPTLNTWTAITQAGPAGSSYVRAHCVAAGNPGFNIGFASPGPSGITTRSRTAEFKFFGYDPAGGVTTFRCKLDGGAYEPCSSPTSYTVPPLGDHTFSVYPVTPDGRASAAQAYSWSVDATPPTVTVQQLKPVTLGASTTVTWTGSDQGTGVKNYEVRHRSAPYNGSFGDPVWRTTTATSVSLPLALGSTLCVVVIARDVAGNGTGSDEQCTTRPLDDRSLTASRGWTRGNGSAYWNGTYTQTKLQGKTLKRTGARLHRVGVVATRCASCGKLAVYVGSTLVGGIDLRAASTKHRQVLVLPAFAPRTGTVTVKVLTRNKLVRIDGLVVLPEPPEWTPF